MPTESNSETQTYTIQGNRVEFGNLPKRFEHGNLNSDPVYRLSPKVSLPMRLKTVACACLLVAATVGGARTLAAASPDCARWIKEYQQGLSRRAVLGKKHLVKAAHHLVVPKPHLQHVSTGPTRVRPPKLSPAEMLKRFKVLCGEDLPDEVLPVAFVPTGLEETLLPLVDTPGDNDTIAGLTGNGTPPPFTPLPPEGLPPSITPPITGVPPTSGLPPTTGFPPIIPPVTPITPSPVPEPGSFLLLLTGLGTIPVVMRMRRKARNA
jgi:hypothetical protein